MESMMFELSLRFSTLSPKVINEELYEVYVKSRPLPNSKVTSPRMLLSLKSPSMHG
uniref:Uncharacterized protein n=1 Tax=Rhizophora mucronata TaxID=61149 RepID=A0A2P2R198_RHIMU